MQNEVYCGEAERPPQRWRETNRSVSVHTETSSPAQRQDVCAKHMPVSNISACIRRLQVATQVSIACLLSAQSTSDPCTNHCLQCSFAHQRNNRLQCFLCTIMVNLCFHNVTLCFCFLNGPSFTRSCPPFFGPAFYRATQLCYSAVLGVVILSVRPSVCLSHACFVTNPKNLPAIFLYQMKEEQSF